MSMDKDTRDRYYRIVGAIQALKSLLDHTTPMPCDAATDALLVVARHAIDQAVMCAWNYANEHTREQDNGDGKHG
jgi:hypothetical protein